MEELLRIRGLKKSFKKIMSIMLVISIIFTSVQLDSFTKIAKAATSYTTLYLKDDTAQSWIGNDKAVIELVDNTYGHDHYIMTQVDDNTWSCRVPSSTYNVTFNRLSPDKKTQWNSWSAGGRDNHSTYHATVPEHGYWDGTAELEEGFREGDVVYLDYYEYADWEKSGATFYVNYTNASKAENNNQDINISSADSKKYSPILLSNEIEEQVYTYTVTKEDEGAKTLRFWRGNSDTLWNCSVTLSYSDYKAGNNCAKIKGWNDTGYVCPYVPRRHITQIDSIELSAVGNKKVNRNIDVDLNIVGETELLLQDETDISIIRLDSNGNEAETSEGQVYFLYDNSASEWNHREMIFKEAGTYKISASATDGVDNFSTETTVTIAEDAAPQALLQLNVGDSEETEAENVFVRNSEGKAHITVEDKSVSEIGDDITSRVYELYYDANNDGEFSEDEIISNTDGNEASVPYELNSVGRYRIKLYIQEIFADTIPALIDDSIYLTGSITKDFEITNKAPLSSMSMEKSKIADIIFTIGNADKDTLSKYAKATETVKERLNALGIEANVSAVSTSALTAKDTFAWEEYDHYNYNDWGYVMPKHISYNDKDIKMTGYFWAPLKDFLYVPDYDNNRKVFEFDLQRDGTDWHSMEGGGFLFNTVVSADENYIQGYCILVTASGLKLVQINKTNLNNFRNGSYEYVQNAGRLLQTFGIGNVYANHHFKIIVDGNVITVYDGDNVVINEYALPDDGADAYGYGPIISHASHGCGQQSYFTFKNIVMQTVTGESLSDVVNNHEWTPGTNHYVINLSDTSVPELSDNDRMSDVAAAMLSNDTMFFGIGNDTTLNQYNALLNSIEGNGENIKLLSETTTEENPLDGVGVETAVNQIVSRIMADIESKDYSIGYTLATDEEVVYKGTYSDPENDPLGSEKWNYVYDASVFGENSSEIQTIVQDAPITMFTNPGAYEISHIVSDNPTGGNDALSGYDRWSDTDDYKKLILSQHRPVAGIKVTTTQSPADSTKCMVNVIYESEDADHPSDSRKGIRDEKFSYKEAGAAEWTEGRFPTQVDMGKTYLIKYTVTDIEGTVSRFAVAAVKTSEAKVYVQPEDNNPPKVNLAVSEQTVEIGDAFYIETSAEDDYGVTEFTVKCNDKEIAKTYGRFEYNAEEAGEIVITAAAVDIGGNTVTETKTVNVIDKSDVTPPVIDITSPHNGAISGITDIIGTIKDNKKLKSYTVTMQKIKNADGSDAESSENITLSSGTEEIINDVIAAVNTDELENGIYKIVIMAEDVAGLTSTVTILITVEEEECDNVPPQAMISDVILDSDNDCILVTGTVTDETLFDRYELTICDEQNQSVKTVIAAGKNEIVNEVVGTIETADLASGRYRLTLCAWDAEGNSCTAGALFTYISGTESGDINRDEDICAPVTAGELSANITASGLNLKLTGTITDGNLKNYSVITGRTDADNNIVSPVTIAAGTADITDSVIAEYTYSEYSEGEYVVRVIAVDNAGNTRTTDYTVTVTKQGTIKDGYEGENGEGGDSEKSHLTMVFSSSSAKVGESINVYMTYPSNASDVKLTADGADVTMYGRNAEIKSDMAGEVNVTLSAVINGEEKTVSQAVRFYDKTDTVHPQAYFTSPEADKEIKTKTEITGSVCDETSMAYYTLEYRMDGTEEYTQIAYGTEPVTDGVLGELDTTKLLNGRYVLRLTAVDNGGNRVRVERSINVAGNLKVGNMSIGFTDMSTDISGLPLSLNRYYDSRNKQSGDFGTGWTIGLQSANLTEASDITQGYSLKQVGNRLGTAYYLVQTECHDVTVTYGDGTSDRFELVVTPDRQGLVPICEVEVRFTCVTNPNVKLLLDGDNKALVYGTQLIFEDDTLFDKTSYVLEREDGTKLYIDSDYGVSKIEDSNGNAISISSTGYKHSDGTGITFTRDSLGRIVSASETRSGTDEIINKTEYTYDSNNNLICVKDNAGKTVNFTYDNNHNMISMIDASGMEVARNEYDEDGRLAATVDSQGNRITYTHDIDGRREVVRDKLGNATVYTYDENGNILQIVDAFGNITQNTYDDNNNLLSSTNALGNVTEYAYDSNNNLVKTIDALGQITTVDYGSRNEILKITQGNLLSVAMTYDKSGNVTSVKDAAGNINEYTYETNGNLSSMSDSIGTIMTLTYDSAGRIKTSTDGTGNTVTYYYDTKGNCTSTEITKQTEGNTVTIRNMYFYDAAGNVVKTIDSLGGEKTLEYDINGRILAMTDEKGIRTSYGYDTLGNITAIYYADGTEERFTYDANENVLTSTDRENQPKTYEYDALGRNTHITLADGNSISYEYDALGNIETYISVTGAKTTYEYDALGRNTSVTDDDGNKITYTYGTSSELLSVTDVLGRTTSYSYDSAGNVISVTYPDETIITMNYDARSRLASETDSMGNTSSYCYDNADRLISVTDSLGNKTEYAYDNLGELYKVTDAKGNTTTYEYDTLGRRISDTDSMGHTRTYQYSSTGNLIQETSYSGKITIYSYDEYDRLESVNISGGEENSAIVTVTYSRDSYGRITGITNETGTVSYTYEEYARVSGVTDTNGTTLVYTYDIYGRKSSVTAVGAENKEYGTTYYEYDKYNRLIKVSDSFGNYTVYTYNIDGTLSKEQSSSGITTLYTYNVCYELISLKTIDADSKTVAEYKYARNAAGDITKIEETTLYADGDVRETTTQYTYDSNGRLTEEVISSTDGSITFRYTYDSLSNRTSQTTAFTGNVSDLIDETGREAVEEGDTVYTYNANSQLIKEVIAYPDDTSKTTDYIYDADGSLIRKTSEKEDTEYRYNIYGCMSSVTVTKNISTETDSDGNITQTVEKSEEKYGYDSEGVRIWKETDGKRTAYVTDKSLTYSQVLAEIIDSGEIYYYTRGNQLVCRTKNVSADNIDGSSVNDGNEKVFYLFDGHGSVKALTGENGNITDNYSYNAYGVTLTKEGTTDNMYYYCGEQMDDATGLYYLRARYMNPLTAAFTQKDRYEGDIYEPVTMNGYLYTKGNPVRYTDPSGNEATIAESSTAFAIIGVLSGIIVVSYQHYLAPYLEMKAQMFVYNMSSMANTLRNEFAAVKHGIEDEWEILKVPEKIEESIIHGIPRSAIDTAPEVFPGCVKEAENETFPAHINQSPLIELGPQAVERNFWDNMWRIEGGSKTIPDKAKDIANQVKAKNGATPQGYKGGRTYKNIPLEDGAQKLPEGITYKEYDVNPYVKGQNRGTERIVIGDDGSVWYTNDHYMTFTQIE